MAKAKNLTINDIVAPGDILALARDTMSRVHTLDGLVVVSLSKDGSMKVEYAGLVDTYHAAGLLESGKLALLRDDDEDDNDE